MNLAVIFAGGTGARMHTKSRPKQFLELNGKPILIYTIELFDNHPQIDGIIVVCIESWIPFLNKMLRKFEISKVVKVIPGGKTGQESIYKGLCAAEEYSDIHKSNDSIVLIHDGVRPLITEETITDNIETVIIKKDDRNVVDIPKRSECRLARAPQSFYLKNIINAHRRSQAEGKNDFIDSCSMMSYYGTELEFIEGPMENIKITTPTDYFVFRSMVEVHENQQIFGIY